MGNSGEGHIVRMGCVVMASGESRRFEGDKLMAAFLGEPMVSRALQTLSGLFERAVVVTRSPQVQSIAARMGYDCVLHELPDVSDTIRLGILRMDGMDGCLFSVADQPLLARGTVISLIEAFFAHPGAIVRARFRGEWGNPAAFPSALFPELAALEPGQTGGAVIRRHSKLLIPVEAGGARELMDVDTREQLAALERIAIP